MTTLYRVFFMLVIPVFAIAAGVAWYALSARYVTTNNAYVKTDMIAISSDIDGRVATVEIRDNQFIEKGQVMYTLDTRPHDIAIKKAKAKLRSMGLRIESLRSQYAQARARIGDAEKRVAYQKKQFDRQQDLYDRGVGPIANLDTASHDLERARQDLSISNEQARQVLAELGGRLDIPNEDHPLYLEAIAALSEAELQMQYAVIKAPADGIASRMQLQPGEWVEEGRPVFSLVGKNNLRIEANLKETQLTKVQIGQSVDISVDAFPDHIWQGRVKHISAATGSEFMVLPPQNATGNWIKVVQRIPVTIEIEKPENGLSLRAGMTVEVSIDTVHEDGYITAMRESLASLLPK